MNGITAQRPSLDRQQQRRPAAGPVAFHSLNPSSFFAFLSDRAWSQPGGRALPASDLGGLIGPRRIGPSKDALTP
jgi:hypothetical protein